MRSDHAARTFLRRYVRYNLDFLLDAGLRNANNPAETINAVRELRQITGLLIDDVDVNADPIRDFLDELEVK